MRSQTRLPEVTAGNVNVRLTQNGSFRNHFCELFGSPNPCACGTPGILMLWANSPRPWWKPSSFPLILFVPPELPLAVQADLGPITSVAVGEGVG